MYSLLVICTQGLFSSSRVSDFSIGQARRLHVGLRYMGNKMESVSVKATKNLFLPRHVISRLNMSEKSRNISL